MASALRPLTRRLLVPMQSVRIAAALLKSSSDSRPVQGAALLHTTARRDILPPPPQTIRGGGQVNDPVPVPPSSPPHGSYHWTFDRLLAAGLIPLTLAPFAAGSLNPTLDAVFCGTMLVHAHMGLQNIIIDYVPKKRFPTAFKLFEWGLRGFTVLVGVGLYEFETNDVGLTDAVKRIWKA